MRETDKVFPVTHEFGTEFGISVRDYIAIQAMTSICANTDFSQRGFDEIADFSYRQADAMIERSEK